MHLAATANRCHMVLRHRDGRSKMVSALHKAEEFHAGTYFAYGDKLINAYDVQVDQPDLRGVAPP